MIITDRDAVCLIVIDMPHTVDGRLLRRHGDEIQNLPGNYFRALGRCDDTMNLGGIKVSSVEIERACNGTAGVAETAAIAVSPVGGGPSMLVMVVMLNDHSKHKDDAFMKKLKADLQTAIKTKLNPLFHISDVVLYTSLPRTASNKIMRRILRDEYLAQRDAKK